MLDKIEIQEVVTQMFVHTDERNWKKVEEQFAPMVRLDYASMTGNPAPEVSPTDITTGWKTVLPGFTCTHHQLGNFVTDVHENTAQLFCYGTATHYLEDEAGNVWTVVGSYDFDLKKHDTHWKISAMTFNYKYQGGNQKLIEKAIESAKSN